MCCRPRRTNEIESAIPVSNSAEICVRVSFVFGQHIDMIGPDIGVIMLLLHHTLGL